MSQKMVNILVTFLVALSCSCSSGLPVLKFKYSQAPFTFLTTTIGDRVTISCETNIDASVSLWQKSTQSKVRVVPDGNKVKQIGQTFTLLITSWHDANQYYCLAEMAGKSMHYVEKSFQVFVLGTAAEKTPKPDIIPKSRIALEKETVKLTCSTVGLLTTLTWYKGNKEISSSSSITQTRKLFRNSRVTSNILTFHNATKSDSGIYTCKAETRLNKGYVAETTMTLTIKDLNLKWIKDSPNMNYVTVGVHESAILDCSLSASHVSVEFYRENNNDSLHKIYPGGQYVPLGKQKLVITDTALVDVGLYVCKAPGITSKKIALFINPGLYGLPLQLHNKVFKFNSMKNYQCGEGIKEFFFKYFPYRR